MEEKLFLNRIEDMLEMAETRYAVVCSDFLEPAKVAAAEVFLRSRSERYFFWGGYEEAERKRLVVYPEYEQEDMALAEVTVVRLRGNFAYVKADHRDFLGAVLGLGLRREKLGDLLVDADGCFVLTTKEIAEFLLQNEIRVKGVPLKGKILAPEEFVPPEADIKVMNVMLASLRLDVVVAQGFHVSRAVAEELIAGHKVKVNHVEEERKDLTVKSGDILSVRGKGKLKVGELSGSTKKGKLKAELLKYGG